LSLSISTKATIAAPLDRLKELATSISTSAYASASLDVQSTAMYANISASASVSAGLDRVKELSCGIETQVALIPTAQAIIGLEQQIEVILTTNLRLSKEWIVSTSISESSSLTIVPEKYMGLRLYITDKASLSNVLFTDYSDTSVGFMAESNGYGIIQEKLDTTHTVVANMTSTYGYIKIGELDGNSFTYGDEQVFCNSQLGDFYRISVFNPEKIVVVYQKWNTTNLYGKIGDIANGSITFGNEYLLKEYEVFGLGGATVTAISDSRLVVLYRSTIYSNTQVLYASVSEKIITVLPNVNSGFNLSILPNNVKILSDNKFIIVGGGENYTGKAVIGTVDQSGHLSFGSLYTFVDYNVDIAYTLSVSALDNNRVIIAYHDPESYNYFGICKQAWIYGTEIVFDDEYIFNDSNITNEINVCGIDESHAIISFQDRHYPTTNARYGVSLLATIDGNGISFSDEYVFKDSHTNQTHLVALDKYRFVVSYVDYLDEAYKSKLGLIAESLNTTIQQSSQISTLANQTIGLRLNSNPLASMGISGGMEKMLSASISAVAESGFELYRALGLTTQIEARAFVTPFVQRARDLQLAMEAFSSTSTGLDAIKALQTLIETVSSATAYGQLSKDLQLAIDAVADTAARAKVDIGLRTDITSTTSLSLAILRLCDLVDAMAANATVGSGLSLDIILSSIFNQHSELYAKAYIELTGSCVIEEHSDFALTMEHIATLVSLIQGSSEASMNPELTHLLTSFVDAKSDVLVTFNTLIYILASINQTSAMSVEGTVFHGIELICSLDAEASAFFTLDRIVQLTDQIDANATWVSVIQTLLRTYMEFKGQLYSGLELSGVLYDRINYSGKINLNTIEFIGGLK